ncbi:pentapeptide repeat-containing protein [Marinobacter panjinensis]|uniref:Pentapeptide repeat-containing protein n=1 Tax=Marinobacter panjinensis TaxID=2576384 RepID=A0A4U6R0H8_9GAMM|nr:pentapeptide repeat-containing protein [Marinobacter panjinensis]MCR8915518.1 pentapeptide repeat-containing protein [Marinobacter panjinensis]TKV66771.1 pentapeptide repeat-containing protein [Marinobacter panjinensis]
MSSGSRQDGGKPERKPTIWQNPAVVAAIMASLIGGVFGVIQVIIPLAQQWGREDNGAGTVVSTEIATDPRELIVQADRMLANTETPINLRIDLIRALKQGSGEGAPPGYHEDAIDILVRYLRQAVGERRHAKDDFGLPYLRKDEYGNQFEPDPRMSRPLSIVAALEALDTIRDAAPTPVEVRIGNIDFSYMNLALLDLSNFNAGHSSFKSAFLSGCDCRGTNFNNGDLSGLVVWGEKQARFDGATFSNTKLGGSKWANVNLTGVDLSRAIGRPAVWLDIEPKEIQAIFR